VIIKNYFPRLVKEYPDLYIGGIENVIKKIRRNIIKKSSIAAVSREIKIPENTLRGNLNCWTLTPLKTLDKLKKYAKSNLWDEIYKECKYLCGKTYTNKIVPPKKLTKELAYFSGLMRDGGLSDYKSELVISQKDIKWLKNVRILLKKIFNIKTKIIGPREKDNCFYIKYRSVSLYAIIHVVLDYKKHNWNTPKIILKAPKRLQKYYVKGFWEAEGSLSSGLSFHQSGNKEHSIPLLDI